MLRYIYGDELNNHPKLMCSMFTDRAHQFGARLAWDIDVDENGHEKDEYDELNPLYVIWEADGVHGGSMRFLPTTGPTMAWDHFSHLNGDEDIASPAIWECTRFCLAPDAPSKVAAALMLGGGELMRAFALTHLLGIFDERMVRIYRLIGSSPEVLGGIGCGRDRISLGLWSFSQAAREKVLQRAGVSTAQSEEWFAQSFGYLPERELEMT